MLRLHYHPLASFCWKALIALYELGVEFEGNVVDLMDPAQAAALKALWPVVKFPVLEDEGRVIVESTIVIEYLNDKFGGQLLPKNAKDSGIEARMLDRIFDLDLHIHMQKIVTDRLRPADSHDPFGVADARRQIRETYGYLETRLKGKDWAAGDFGIADIAALPALFYGNEVEPLGDSHPVLSAYLERLKARPSIARVLREAEPFMKNFPEKDLWPASPAPA